MNGKFILLLVVLALFLFLGCISSTQGDNNSLVGNDKDEHGCISSAGYSWCEGKQKCLRVWEEPCEMIACTMDAMLCPDGINYVGRVAPDCNFAPCPIIVGGDKDEHGCIPSAGYSWCEEKQKCLRVWEEDCNSLNSEEGAQKG